MARQRRYQLQVARALPRLYRQNLSLRHFETSGGWYMHLTPAIPTSITTEYIHFMQLKKHDHIY
jgi:hypothetical protein